ncbi:hypothetical protein ABGA94_00005, partial [Stenotrophomonas sp. 3diitr2024]
MFDLPFCKGLSSEVAGQGITVNAIAPGRINSAQILERLHPTEESTLELLPNGWLDGLGLPPLRSALLTVHRPPPDADLAA